MTPPRAGQAVNKEARCGTDGFNFDVAIIKCVDLTMSASPTVEIL